MDFVYLLAAAYDQCEEHLSVKTNPHLVHRHVNSLVLLEK